MNTQTITKTSLLKQISDGYQNMMLKLGLKQSSTGAATYNWDPLINNRQQLEYMFSYSFVARQAIEIPAKDMTRTGITIQGLNNLDNKKIQKEITVKEFWPRLGEALCWARLYGGAILFMRIDGQDPSTPLDINTIGLGQFVGFEVLSRWQVNPSIGHVINDGGPNHGEPESYMSVFDNSMYALPYTIHHSRVIKLVGIKVPWFQRLQLMFWGQSVLVNIRPQITSYDAISASIDQMAHKSHQRVFKIKGMKEQITIGGEEGEQNIANYVQNVRNFQSNEDITAIDAEDDYVALTHNFTGLKDLLESKGEQISAATGIPQSKLFGRPADGLGASQAGDIELYYSNLESDRERDLRTPVNRVLEVLSRSTLGRPLPEDSSFTFDSLYTLDNKETSELASNVSDIIIRNKEANIITVGEARAELQRNHLQTRMFSELDPLPPTELTETDTDFSNDVQVNKPNLTQVKDSDDMVDAIRNLNDHQ